MAHEDQYSRKALSLLHEDEQSRPVVRNRQHEPDERSLRDYWSSCANDTMQTAFHLFKFGGAERRGDASQSLSMGPSAKSYTHRAVEHGVRRLEGRLVHFRFLISVGNSIRHSLVWLVLSVPSDRPRLLIFVELAERLARLLVFVCTRYNANCVSSLQIWCSGTPR